MAALYLIAATNLNDRDAIHIDDLGFYDTYMNTVQGRHAIDMYMENDRQVIKVDLYDGATDTFEETASFKVSHLAPAYFAQLDSRAREHFGSDYDTYSQNERRN